MPFNIGIEMPALGLGVFHAPSETTAATVENACVSVIDS